MVGKQRNFGLDVVRAISILLVLSAHRFTFNIEIGIVGVQIFFILSGFLIGQILLNDFKNGGNTSTIIKFWKRRWYRTLPLYYLVLLLKILIYGNPLGVKMIVYFVFMQANFVGIDFFPVSWSLVVEEWFYIFLPLATLIFIHKSLNPKKFLIFLLSFISAFFIVRFSWNYFHKGAIIYQFDCLLLGVMLALLKMHYNNIYQKLNSSMIFVLGFIGVVLLTIQLGDMNDIPLFSPYFRVTWYFLISICIACMIPFTELSTFLNHTVRNIKPLYSFFTWTSILTYSLYLIHGEIINIHFSFSNGINLILQIILLTIISFILYALYEHPMMTLREKLSFHQYTQSIKSFSFKI